MKDKIYLVEKNSNIIYATKDRDFAIQYSLQKLDYISVIEKYIDSENVFSNYEIMFNGNDLHFCKQTDSLSNIVTSVVYYSGSSLISYFYVEAESEREAKKIAKEMFDYICQHKDEFSDFFSDKNFRFDWFNFKKL